MSGEGNKGSQEHQGRLAALSGLAEECQKQQETFYRPIYYKEGWFWLTKMKINKEVPLITKICFPVDLGWSVKFKNLFRNLYLLEV